MQEAWDAGEGLASANRFYAAVRFVGEQIRRVSDLDREALARDGMTFNVHLIVGGQIRGEAPQLYLVYPQGNPLRATPESPFVQIGESKYGRPILDRGIRFAETTMDVAVKYAMISIDSTMRSNMAVGPPIDLVTYANDELEITQRARLLADDAVLVETRTKWERELRRVIPTLPSIVLSDPRLPSSGLPTNGSVPSVAAAPATTPAPHADFSSQRPHIKPRPQSG